ncbi:tetratricopeptide repeat protein [Poriferisphaera sp. WC338]|uniref:tetratricopeptide repeat protein n=1 Tax=Poriferisphaera sp. WC338 TaxID=3425129 RepID=UPI003D817CB3
MAEQDELQSEQLEAGDEAGGGDELRGEAVRPVSFEELHWSQVWQLPVLLLGIGMFVLGVWLVLPADVKHDFDGKLKSAREYLHANNLDAAAQTLADLNPVLFNSDQGTAAHEAEYWYIAADLNYLQNAGDRMIQTQTIQENNKQILKYYDDAVGLGAELGPQAIKRYAETLIALGRMDQVRSVIDQLKDDHMTRQEIFKRLVAHEFDRRWVTDGKGLVSLIAEYSEMLEHLGKADRVVEDVWLTDMRAALMLEAGDGEAALDFLLKRIQRLNGRASDRQLAGLTVKLARAYELEGELESAKRYYQLVQQHIERDDDLNADIYTGLGRIALAGSDPQGVQQAQAYFATVVKEYPLGIQSPYVGALLGAADCEARLGEFASSVEHFRQAAQMLSEQARPGDRRRDEMLDVVQSHIRFASENKEYEQALEYLKLLRPLYGKDLPARVLLSFATTHEKIGEQAAAKAAAIDPRETGDASVARVASFKRRNKEGVIHFGTAGDYYLEHARAVTIGDNAGHGESLWKSAENYDRANKWEDAVDVYAEFVKTRESDPRRVRAMNHLGRALFTLGQYKPAIEKFSEVVRDHPRTIEAYEARVMLAKAYEKEGEVEKALRGLEQVVVDDPVVTPDSKQYREALIELGRMYYKQIGKDDGAAEQAIETLTKGVERYGSDDEGGVLRFMLADAYRKSIPAIDQELSRKLTNKQHLELNAERSQRLKKAQEYFHQAKTDLESRPEGTLTPLEQMYLRNSYFYKADCAYDQQHFPLAIELYEEAARKWEHDPSSMVALVQIVNARCELGQFQEAKLAHDQAIWQLSRIPEEAFNQPGLPMTRQHWEDWLRWSSELNLFKMNSKKGNVMPVSQ